MPRKIKYEIVEINDGFRWPYRVLQKRERERGRSKFINHMKAYRNKSYEFIKNQISDELVIHILVTIKCNKSALLNSEIPAENLEKHKDTLYGLKTVTRAVINKLRRLQSRHYPLYTINTEKQIQALEKYLQEHFDSRRLVLNRNIFNYNMYFSKTFIIKAITERIRELRLIR